MNWLKIADGYVRIDSIIDVHINTSFPKTIYFLLSNGTSVKYKTFNSAEEAVIGMEEFLKWIHGGTYTINDIKLP